MKNPELRFKNDIDDWETFELGNIGSTYNGLNGKSKTDFGHGEAKYITYMNVYKNTISNPKIVDNIEIDNTQNKVVYGDILFTTSSETPEEVGMSSVWVSNEDNIYLNSFCFGYRPTKELNPIFMGYLLRANSFREQMMLLAQGISRYNISKTKAMKITIELPSLEIQSQIATLLSDIDTKIETQEQKIEKLKVFKSAMLDKMFPKEGQKVPEIRFSGFSGDWEENVLGNVCETITDGAHNSPKEINRGYYMPSVKDMTNNGFDFSECKQISKNDFETLKKQGCMPKIGDILVSKDGSILSFCFSVKEKVNYVILSSIAIIRPKQILNNLFLEQYFKKDDFKNLTINQYSKGNALKRIVLKDFRTIKIQIPTTLEEQEKIGKYFEELDNKIELEISKLNKLKDIKNAMLNKLLP